jgi:hypothetical protein
MIKIGIITIHSDLHYGAILQAFALNKVLSGKYESKIIDYRKKPTNLPQFSLPKMLIYHLVNLKKAFRFRRFLKTEISINCFKTVEELMNNFSDQYDVILTGSDQVWNPAVGGMDTLNPIFFGAFAAKEKYKKISYASSVGNHIYSEEEKILVKKWLSEYSHLSTREIFGKKQLEDILNVKVDLVLDPTLLMTKNQWLKVAIPVKIKYKYLLVYNVGNTIDVDSEYARKIADENGWKVVFMSVRLKKDKNIDINIPHCGPGEFIWLFNNAEYVVTSSFHGVAFSINFKKKFINVYNPNSPQRIDMLLNSLGLNDRTVKSIDDLQFIKRDVDYQYASIQLDRLRKISYDYLINSIEN